MGKRSKSRMAKRQKAIERESQPLSENKHDDEDPRQPPRKSLKVSKHHKKDSGDNNNAATYVHCPLEVSFPGKNSGGMATIPPPAIELNEGSDKIEVVHMTKIWKYFFQNESKECTPSPIQKQSWALILKSISLIGISPTGSGKTLAYAIPTLLSAATNNANHPLVLVLAPTRELVYQVARVYKKVSKAYTKTVDRSRNQLRVVTIHGGVDRAAQSNELETVQSDQLRIVIATPGRLLDLIDSYQSVKKQLVNPCWIVLDEADQLAKEGDLGPQVDQIFQHVRKDDSSKTALISATLPERVRPKFEEWIGERYALVKIDSLDKKEHVASTVDPETSQKEQATNEDAVQQQPPETADICGSSLGTIPANIEQILHVCAEHKKAKKLIHTLQSIKKEHTARNHPLGIIFFSKIDKLKYVSKLLQKENVKCLELHGQLPNHIREKNLHLFAVGQVPIILATDIAARGIHVNNIRFVIQYDFPGNLNQYIHRCGRAGRSGDSSKCYSFFTRNLQPMAPDLIKLLHGNNAWIDPNLKALAPGVADQLGEGTSNRKRRRKNISQINEKSEPPSSEEEDDYAELAPNRIVLKRASHVSDASDSSGEEDEE